MTGLNQNSPKTTLTNRIPTQYAAATQPTPLSMISLPKDLIIADSTTNNNYTRHITATNGAMPFPPPLPPSVLHQRTSTPSLQKITYYNGEASPMPCVHIRFIRSASKKRTRSGLLTYSTASNISSSKHSYDLPLAPPTAPNHPAPTSLVEQHLPLSDHMHNDSLALDKTLVVWVGGHISSSLASTTNVSLLPLCTVSDPKRPKLARTQLAHNKHRSSFSPANITHGHETN